MVSLQTKFEASLDRGSSKLWYAYDLAEIDIARYILTLLPDSQSQSLF